MPPIDFTRGMPGRGFPKQFYKVQGASIHAPITGIIVADFLFQVRSHFCTAIKRHQPSSKGEVCLSCGKPGTRLKAYVAAVRVPSMLPFVLEFTENAVDKLAEMTAHRQNLRGVEVQLTRRSNKEGIKTKQSPVEVRILAEHTPAKLPPSFDELPHLERMWGLAELAD